MSIDNKTTDLLTRKLSPLQINILIRLAEGQRPTVISQALKVGVQHISNTKCSEAGRNVLELLLTNRQLASIRTTEMIGDLVPLALENLMGFLTSPVDAIRYRASTDILKFFLLGVNKFPETNRPLSLDKVNQLKELYKAKVKQAEADGTIVPHSGYVQTVEAISVETVTK